MIKNDNHYYPVFATQLSGFRDLMADVPLSLSSEEGAQSSLRMQGDEICEIAFNLALDAERLAKTDMTAHPLMREVLVAVSESDCEWLAGIG